jgi:hypothetical protein
VKHFSTENDPVGRHCSIMRHVDRRGTPTGVAMRSVLPWPACSGMGTLTERLRRHMAIPHLFTGEVFRHNISACAPRHGQRTHE